MTESADEMSIDPEIAAAMGFSSFGGQNKKRRLNEKETAVVPHGANAIELGRRSLKQGYEDGRQEGMKHGAVPSDSSADPTPPNKRAPASATANPNPVVTAAAAQNILPTRVSTSDGRILANNAQTGNPAPPSNNALQADGLPAKPAFVEQPAWGSLTQTELDALRTGVKDENGDMAFFMPSFVEDPWGRLDRVWIRGGA